MMDNRRMLGYGETFCKFSHDFGHSTGVSVFFVRVKGNINKKTIQKALYYLCQKHPALRVSFKSEIKYDYFELNPSIEIESLPIEFKNNQSRSHWMSIVENELIIPFKDTQLQWKMTFLLGTEDIESTHDMIIKFHHSIIDGISMTCFIKDFLTYCDEIAAELSPEFQSQSLLPAVETMLVKQNSKIHFALQQIILGFKFYFLKKYLFPFQKWVPLQERVAKNIYVKLNENKLILLLQKCKNEKTTITSALNAALMIAIADTYHSRGKQIAMTPVNLRHFCQPPISTEYIGCMVSWVPTILNGVDRHTNVWNLAREYRAQLEKNISTIGHPPAKYNKKSIYRLFCLSKKGSLSKKFAYGIGVTNVGKTNSHIKKFNIEEFYFSTSHVSGDSIILLHVLSMNDVLFLCFNYTIPLISDEVAQKIKNNFLGILNLE